MAKRPIKVLLIEDNKKDAHLVQDILSEVKGEPFDLEWVDQLSTGLTRLSSVQVILLALPQPESSLLITLDKMRAKAPSIPIIILTDYENEALALEALHKGAQEYLIKKDLNRSMLTRVLRYAIKRNLMVAVLEETSKKQLQMKEQFLSNVSHELRTPLAVIHQFITILLDGFAGEINQDQCEYLEITLKNVNQLRSMISDLLEVTRADTGKLTIEPRNISLSALINETLKMLQTTATQKGISLAADIPADLPFVYADPERMRQVLTNLINNSIKFTSENGMICIKAQVWDENPNFLSVSLTDNGCGIKPEDMQIIFDRLYQDQSAGKGCRKGLGLGLYICKELVVRQGGQIWAESKLEHGSTFSFTLPIFSLSSLILPVITENNQLRTPVALLKVEVFNHEESHQSKMNESILQEVWHILQRCSLPDLDVLLPRMTHTPKGENFYLVACADIRGAEILVKRIQQQLTYSQRLRETDIKPSVSFTMVDIPSEKDNKPLDQLTKEIVTNIANLMLPKEGSL